jgi:para-aminobenzoate synthetase
MLFLFILFPLSIQAFVVLPRFSRPFSPLLLTNRNNKERNPAASQSSSEWSGSGRQGQKYNVSLLLIDHYDSFTYNLYDMLAQLTVEPPVVVAKDVFENADGSNLPEFFERFDGIVLSPGPGTPHEQPSLSHRAISDNPNKPLLGVCLGHQLMALAYGAKVDRAPMPIHGQDHWIVQQQGVGNNSLSLNVTDKNNDATSLQYPSLFENLPNSFRVVRYHSLCAYDLPQDQNLIVTAKSSDNVIQAMQHASNPHYGVQFHPESIGTQFGMGLLENFVKVVQERTDEQKYQGPASFKTVSLESLMEAKANLLPRQSAGEQGSSPSAQETRPSRFQVIMHRVPTSNVMIQPLHVFERYYARESHSVWLDSSSFPSRGELDILAAPTRKDDILEYHQGKDDTDVLTVLENELFGPDKQYGPTTMIGWVKSTNNNQLLDSSLLEWIDETSAESASTQVELPPFHYRGGFLGFLGYEVRHDTLRFLRQQEGGQVANLKEAASNEQKNKAEVKSTTPTAAFFLARQSMVFHHPSQSWYLIGIGLAEDDQDYDETFEWMNCVIEDFKNWTLHKETENNSITTTGKKSDTVPLKFIPNRPKNVYEKDIESCHEYIRQGESYELCLTNQLETRVATSKRSSFDLYKGLRNSNPAPYSSYFRWNVQSNRESETEWSDVPNISSLILCSSSPERFMSVSRLQPHPEVPSFLQAEAKPIKGTAARVIPQDGMCRTDAESREDERRARSLELSLKDRAENLMIVDLLRNDLSRVCQIGTVHVSKLMDIESFETVHQMVSTIRGTLSSTQTSIDLLRASFPGGSMTGAPKIRTMELLQELEQDAERGPYSGSLGYISVNGCMDMNIIIRTAVLTLDEAEGAWKVSVGAGGAITALSNAEEEYYEMKLKARAVVAAVQEWASFPQDDSFKERISIQNLTSVGQA